MGISNINESIFKVIPEDLRVATLINATATFGFALIVFAFVEYDLFKRYGYKL